LASLPELSYRELVSLLRRFCQELRGEGSPVIVGKTRSGKSFTVHHHPGHAVYPEKLAKILKYAEISREQFWEWFRGA